MDDPPKTSAWDIAAMHVDDFEEWYKRFQMYKENLASLQRGEQTALKEDLFNTTDVKDVGGATIFRASSKEGEEDVVLWLLAVDATELSDQRRNLYHTWDTPVRYWRYSDGEFLVYQVRQGRSIRGVMNDRIKSID
jgi:hypothetical protein